MVEELSRDDLTQSIDQVVQELLAEAGVEGPPVDAVAIAQSPLGMTISDEPRATGRGRGRKPAGEKVLFLPPGASLEERQRLAADAVGEHFRPLVLERLGFDPAGKRPFLGESLSGLFAARLLLPTQWFRGDAASCSSDLADLKKCYPTATLEAIAWRLLDLPVPCIITVVDDGKVHRRRSNAWRVNKRLEPVEVRCHKQVEQDREPHSLRAEGWTVSGWSAPTEGWQRVILRSVVDSDTLAGV
jgi:hypothetical protein